MAIEPKQVIETAKRMLKLEQTNEHDGDFIINLKKGYMALYNLNTYMEFDAYLPVVNNRVAKPKGYYEFKAMALNTNVPIVYYKNKYKSSNTAQVPIDVTYYDYFNTVEESANYIELGSLCEDATECHLWWYGVPTDENFNYIIDDEAEEPLKYYLAAMFCESLNGLDMEKKAVYNWGRFDRMAGIFRGHLAVRDSRQRKYQLSSTANGVLTFYPY